jgi:tetratricopeptide (TPR) repeat protein
MHGKMADLLHKVQGALCVYLEKVRPSISPEWWRELVEKRGRLPRNTTSLRQCDLQLLLHILDANWREISGKENLSSEDRNYSKEMETVRNRWSHSPTNGPTKEDYCRDLDTMYRFLRSIKADEKLIEDVSNEEKRATLERDFIRELLKQILEQAGEYMEEENYDKAIEKYSKVIESGESDDKEKLQAYFGRAIARETKNDIEGVVADISEAIKLEPDDIKYYMRAYGYLLLGRMDDAIADFNKMLEQEEFLSKSMAYNGRGKAYRDKGDYDQAIQDFTKAIETDEDVGGREKAEAYNNRGRARQEKGDLVGAEKDLQKAVELAPDEKYFQFNLAAIRRRLGR